MLGPSDWTWVETVIALASLVLMAWGAWVAFTRPDREFDTARRREEGLSRLGGWGGTDPLPPARGNLRLIHKEDEP